MQRVKLALWWATLKIRTPINYLIQSNNISSLGVMWFFMRILLVLICWIPPLVHHPMIYLALFKTPDRLFLLRVFQLVHQLFLESTSSWSTSPKIVTSLDRYSKGNGTSLNPCLPWWAIKMIEDVGTNVGDICIGWHTRSHKQQPSVSLMTLILDTCDPKIYADAQGKPEWEYAMWHEINSLENNHNWDLIPRMTGKNVVKCQWVYHTKFTFDGAI